MAEGKHTPGPWIAEDTNSARLSMVVVSALRGANGSTVVIGQCAGPDKEANAQLITAAPDMRAALLKAREFITNGIELGFIRMPDPATPDSAHDTLPMIDDAIALAEGRSNG